MESFQKGGVSGRTLRPVSKVYNERLLETCVSSLISASGER
jgi:hypothetical protein